MGAPVSSSFTPNKPDPFTQNISGAQTYTVSLYDAAGQPTLMLPGQSLTLNPTSNLSLQSTPSSQAFTSGSQSANLSSTDLNSQLSYSIQGTRNVSSASTLNISATSNWASITPSTFTLAASTAALTQPKVTFSSGGGIWPYGLGAGSDGKLYIWGGYTTSIGSLQQTSVSIGGPGSIFPQPAPFNIPSGCLVRQISSGLILDTCGYMWKLSSKFPVDGGSLTLAPYSTLAPIVQFSDGGAYGLMRDGTVQNLNTQSLVDLTLMGSESATAVSYSTQSNTLYILTSQGHLFSDYGNGTGAAGRGTTAASVGLGRITFSGEPDTVTVTSFAANSYGTSAVTLSDGTLWGWGNNSSGYAGKDPSQITQLNSPALIPLPAGVIPNKVTSDSGNLVLFGGDQSSSPTIWTFAAGNFASVGQAPSGNPWVQYINGQTGVDPNGNCSDPSSQNNYRVASVGQFGPAYSYDSLITSNIFIQEGLQSSVVIGNVVNEVAGHTFSLQFSGVHTKCYPSTSQLNVAWDLVGNGSYTTPASVSTAATGYSVYQAALNYPAAGRYKVGLQVTTPAGNVYTSIVVIGVDAANPTTISLSDTRTVSVASSDDHALAIGGDGKIYAWGQNYCDQLGISSGTYQTLNVPSLVPLSDSATISAISSGIYTSYAVDSAGKVFAWGSSPGPNGGNSGLTPTQITELSSTSVLDIAAGLGYLSNCVGNGNDVAYDVANRSSYSGNYGVTVALTSSGKLLQWSHKTGVAAVPGSAGVIFRQILPSGGELYALDNSGNIWTWEPNANTALTQVTTVVGVSKLRAGSNVVVALLSDGSLRAEVNNGFFGVVSVPLNTVFADAQAFYRDGIAAITSAGNIYSTQLSYATVGGISSLTNSTWVPISQNVATSPTDLPITQPKSDQFLAFGSNRLFAFTNNGYQGNCGLVGYYDNVQGKYISLNRVISQGQFGDAYNPDTIRIGSLTATIGSGTASAVSQGGLIAASAGTSVVIRAQNITSQCYAANLAISADVSGLGRFLSVPLSNEGGTLNYVIPTTIPSSGRSTVTIRAQAVSGLTLSFSLNLASFSTTPSNSITNRTQPFVTAQDFGLAVGSDGNAYGWANNKKFNFLINSSPPFSSYSPTKVIMPNSVRVADIGAASTGNDFGVLVLDTSGRTWTWGTSAKANLPITTFDSGSTPTTPTLVPGLAGINIKRLAVSNDGYSFGNAMAALSNTGVVYVWNSTYRTPIPVNALAGLDIVDIHINNDILFALTSSGDLYTSFSGMSGWNLTPFPQNCTDNWGSISTQNLSDASQTCLLVQRVSIPDPVKSFSNYTGNTGVNGTLVVTTTGKVYFFGRDIWAVAQLPRLVVMPSNLSASFAGGISPYIPNIGKGLGLPQVIATNGKWLSLVAQPDGSLTLAPTDDFIPNVEALVPGISGFSDGDGFGARSSSGQLYTLSSFSVPGSCLVDSPTFNRVMSDGQFGPSYHTDQIDISASGPNLFRPGVSTPIYLTATSVCNGGTGITFDHQILGESSFSGSTAGTASYDQMNATAVYNFTASGNGVNWITFRATTSSGVTNTYQFEADISPAPPVGLLGISINNGDRYTNSRNVTINMVWPDGALVAYVSNDGGFVPGTFATEPLVSRISWVLPPQAAVPLPALVYARFGDTNALTYFDDIIMDSNPPILTFASATPNS